MPIEESARFQRDVWGRAANWLNHGEEWSVPWKNSRVQWLITVYPRIAHLLPAATILEIAPGHGRFTHFVKDYCERLIGVDVTPNCVEICKQRFDGDLRLEFHIGDGFTLPMVADRSIDLVFSYDSLVHVGDDIMHSYLIELGKKLAPEGVGFLHHSNLGECPKVASHHYRHPAMTAAKFRDFSREAGLACVRQEIFNWRNANGPIDCYSWISRAKGEWTTKIVRHDQFGEETLHARRLAALLE
jgi:predicted TPR repeat methyltransferase